MSEPAEPLILTADLDLTSFALFDALRQKHYPAGLNRVSAHLSLFHRLPGLERPVIREQLCKSCRTRPAPALRFTGLRNLGRGVAFLVESPELSRLHAELATAFHPWLSAQDQQRFHPHVVVQNKAAPNDAKHLLTLLQAEFSPWTALSTGVTLWQYCNGPWRFVETFRFAHAGAADI